MNPSLEALVALPLSNAFGQPLRSVSYGAIRGELAGLDLEPPLYLGGEIALEFGAACRMVIAVDENAGWGDHFSLRVRNTSGFVPGALEEVRASHLGPWSRLIGQVLKSWRVLGSNQTPHVVELTFDRESVYLGDARETVFGDGDDILVSLELGPFEGVVLAESR